MDFAEDDATVDWSGGMDAWNHPDRIKPNQVASAVNTTTRGGVLSPRLGYTEMPITFEPGTLLTTTFGYARTAQDVWTTGKFQALIPYSRGDDCYVITVISGYIFKTNVDTFRTEVLSKTVRVNQYSSRINWSYAAGAVVLFDYPNYPVIIQETGVTRADSNHKINGLPAPQIPISNLGAYNQNRLVIANVGVEWTAGDVVGNLAAPEAPLTFTEVLLPSSPYYRQVFSLPVTDAMDPITAMGFIQQIDTSTGIGQLFVATQTKVYTYLTNQPRSQWGQGSFGTLLLANSGMAGPRSFVNVNSDLVFLNGNGALVAMSSARNDQKRWGQTPISREVDNYLKFSDLNLARFAALGYYRNRIFITANPYRTTALDTNQQPVADYAHGGFVMLELEDLASFFSEGNPVWGGLWTGVDPMDMCTLMNNKCVVAGKYGGGKFSGNALYLLEHTKRFDTIKGRKRQVRSIVYTRQYNHNIPFDFKRERSVAMHLQSLAGRVNLVIERKPSHSNVWNLYAEWNHDAPVTSCELPLDELINGIDRQQLRQLVWGDGAKEGCNPITGDSYITYRGIQYRLTITADYWELEDFKIRAYREPNTELMDQQLCTPLPTVKLAAQCMPDWNILDEDLCLT